MTDITTNENWFNSYSAECGVIGAVILAGGKSDDTSKATSILKPEDFLAEDNRLVWQAILELYQKHGDFDGLTIRQKVKDEQGTDLFNHLTAVTETVPSPANLLYYMGIVREKSQQRQLAAAGERIFKICRSTTGIEEKLKAFDDARATIQTKVENETIVLSESLQAAYAALEHKKGLITGFRQLDQLTCGLQQGNMVILAGRPGHGKTSLALNIATNVSRSHIVLFFSLEMTHIEISQRLLRAASGITRRGDELELTDYTELAGAVTSLSRYKLKIIEKRYLTPEILKAKCRIAAKNEAIALVVVDYIGLMRPNDKAKSLYESMTAISRDLKLAALELNVPLIAVAQLNRQVTGRNDGRPRMSDLRDSGGLEQDADLIVLVHREDEMHKGDSKYEPNGQAEIIIDKNRSGSTGLFRLDWHAELTSFQDIGVKRGEW